MTQEITGEQSDGQPRRRGRGPTRPFPSVSFEDALLLPRSILDNGVDGEIDRLTLLGILDYSPSSSKTRDWISSSLKYGLTTGSYNAPFLRVTDDGRLIASSEQSNDSREKQFELAIGQFRHFSNTYDRLKGQRLPDDTVLHGELRRAGLSDSDGRKAAEVFTANLRSLGLVQVIAGSDYVRDIEQFLDGLPANHLAPSNSAATNALLESSEGQFEEQVAPPVPSARITSSDPALHIDIQIHIDSSASADQIDQIFASMARHLYGRED